jgi:hypothetical protein
MSRKPVLKEDFLIEVTADNKVIDKEIKSLIPVLLEYLRKELNNDFPRSVRS